MIGKFHRLAVGFLLVAIFLLPQACFAEVPLAQIGNNKIKLELAITQAQIERGLMERQSMPEEQGMVFLYRPAASVRFWMFNCLMSLDMMFIKDGRIVKICRDVPPYKLRDTNKAPLYPPDGEVVVDEVIEVNAGYCASHGIKEGDTVKFELPGFAASGSSAAPLKSNSAGTKTSSAAEKGSGVAKANGSDKTTNSSKADAAAK